MLITIIEFLALVNRIFLALILPIIAILAMSIALLISIIFMRGGVIARRSIQELDAKDFPHINPRYIDTWKFYERQASRQSFWVIKLILISLSSIFAGTTAFILVFVPLSLTGLFIFYRIWRVPNDYLREISLTKKDIWNARKKPAGEQSTAMEPAKKS